MRISSFLVLAKEYSEDVRVIAINCSDNSETYCGELGCLFARSNGENLTADLNEGGFKSNLLVINLDRDMSLKKFKNILDVEINRLKSTTLVIKGSNKKIENSMININNELENISWIYFDKLGFKQFVSNGIFDNMIVEKIITSDKKSNKINISENIGKNIKNPLFLFGIPGLLMILTSFVLVYNVVGRYDSIDSVSMGTAFVTIGATVLGILSLMAAIISYILGKQTEFILTNYSD